MAVYNTDRRRVTVTVHGRVRRAGPRASRRGCGYTAGTVSLGASFLEREGTLLIVLGIGGVVLLTLAYQVYRRMRKSAAVEVKKSGVMPSNRS